MDYKQTFIYKFIRLTLYKYLEYRERLKYLKVQLLWRDYNRHNYTRIVSDDKKSGFPIEKVKVGKFTYGPLNVKSYGSNDEFLEIGDFCSIADGVKFILGGEHKFNTFSTYPFRRIFFDNNYTETFSKGPIIVEDDVWIGTDALILSGVKLSRGTVVAAGSVVVKSTEPYSIVGGNPAKLIKKRFDDKIIEQLINFDFNSLSVEIIKGHIDCLENSVDGNWNINELYQINNDMYEK